MGRLTIWTRLWRFRCCPARAPLGPGGIGTQSFDSGGAQGVGPPEEDAGPAPSTGVLPPHRRFELAFLSSRRTSPPRPDSRPGGGGIVQLSQDGRPYPSAPSGADRIVTPVMSPAAPEPNLDVIEYQLYGLMLRPVVSDAMIGQIESTLTTYWRSRTRRTRLQHPVRPGRLAKRPWRCVGCIRRTG